MIRGRKSIDFWDTRELRERNWELQFPLFYEHISSSKALCQLAHTLKCSDNGNLVWRTTHTQIAFHIQCFCANRRTFYLWYCYCLLLTSTNICFYTLNPTSALLVETQHCTGSLRARGRYHCTGTNKGRGEVCKWKHTNSYLPLVPVCQTCWWHWPPLAQKKDTSRRYPAVRGDLLKMFRQMLYFLCILYCTLLESSVMNKGLTYEPEHSGDCYIGNGCLLISGLSHPRVHQRPQLLAAKIKMEQMNIDSHKQTLKIKLDRKASPQLE